jgi:HEAT repeat protein
MAKSIALLTFAALLTQGLPAFAQFATPAPLPTPIPSSTPSLKLPDVVPFPPGRRLPLEQPFPSPPKPQATFSLSDRLNELRTANTELRRVILKDLSDPKRKIIPDLIIALKTESDPLVKSALAEVLAKRWEEATPAIDDLVVMLADKRRALVSRSEYISPPDTFLYPESYDRPIRRTPSLSPGNPTQFLRVSAIEALGNIGLPAREKATRSLTALLQDENPLVRVNAVWALLEIGADVPVLETWLSVLQSSDSEARQAAARLVQWDDSLLRKAFGSEATPKTITQLVALLDASEQEVRTASRSSLKLLGKEVMPDLISALESSSPLIRLNATQLLGNFGNNASEATSSLIKRLRDPGEYIPPPKPFDHLPLLRPIEFGSTKPTTDDRSVRTNAAIALGSIGSAEAIPALKIGLKDPYPKMRLACAWALTQLNQTESVIPVLAELLNDPKVDGDLQYDIILNLDLGAMALPGVSRLREALEKPDITARGYAVTVLASIYEDLARQNTRGETSKADRHLATQELTKILAIVTKPGAKFNKPPVDRLRLVQTKL